MASLKKVFILPNKEMQMRWSARTLAFSSLLAVAVCLALIFVSTTTSSNEPEVADETELRVKVASLRAQIDKLPLPLSKVPSSINIVSMLRAVDFYRFESSAAAFCQHFDFNQSLGTWFVVVPDEDEEFFKTNLPKCRVGSHPPSIPFCVVPESTIVPAFHPAVASSRRKVRGYIRQMVLKIGVATLMPKGSYYLVLDSDVYPYMDFDIKDLFVEETTTGQGAIVRAKVDLEHPVYGMDFRGSAAVLGLSSVMRATADACRNLRYQSIFPSDWSPLFDESRENRLPSLVLDHAKPFQLYSSIGRELSPLDKSPVLLHDEVVIFGACAEGDKGIEIGFTPLILHSSVINNFLIPTLELLHCPSADDKCNWSDGLLKWHFEQVDVWYLQLLRSLGWPDRVMSWTEYGIYFYSSVASGLFDKLYAISGKSKTGKTIETGILNYDRSIMVARDYHNANWGALFNKTEPDNGQASKRPTLLIHSWLNFSVDEINNNIAPFMPEMKALLQSKLKSNTN